MLYGLMDCNNFFVSCERVFRPDLEQKPVVVLSNNDGCIVSRSNEAKEMAIPMGMPFFQLKEALFISLTATKCTPTSCEAFFTPYTLPKSQVLRL